jgi:hypothetical protein
LMIDVVVGRRSCIMKMDDLFIALFLHIPKYVFVYRFHLESERTLNTNVSLLLQQELPFFVMKLYVSGRVGISMIRKIPPLTPMMRYHVSGKRDSIIESMKSSIPST